MNHATQRTVAVFGVLTGLAGIEHGIGEMLQGNSAAGRLVIHSWPDSRFYEILNGEPALTILPNLLLTGVLAVGFSVLYILWATIWARSRRSPWILLGLTAPMLLFGAGFGPPILGAIIAAAAFRIHRPIRRGLTAGRARLKRAAGTVWPWVFAAALICWLGVLAGVGSLYYFWGFSSDALITGLIAGMFGFLLLTILSAFRADMELPGYEVA